MKFFKLLFLIQACMISLYAVNIKKKGTETSYVPYSLGITRFFLPYNPSIIFVGDHIANLVCETAQILDCSANFCFTPNQNDFETLNTLAKKNPNIYTYYGIMDEEPTGMRIYYETLPVANAPDFFRFAGSLLKPNNKRLSFLFGQESLTQTFSLSQLCKEKNISKVHMFYLNCGGNELKILQSSPKLISDSIVVMVKTYHQQFRENLSSFKDLHAFMNSCDFVLMSHYIYDNLIGDALYIKRKYYNAVFKRNNI